MSNGLTWTATEVEKVEARLEILASRKEEYDQKRIAAADIKVEKYEMAALYRDYIALLTKEITNIRESDKHRPRYPEEVRVHS